MEVQQLLVQPGEGLGRRARGDAQTENYASFGDGVAINLDPAMLGFAANDTQLNLLAVPQVVAVDGTIFLPLVGRLPVEGLTERQIESLVEQRLSTFYKMKINLSVRILPNPLGKTFFAFGEVMLKGSVPMNMVRFGDVTVLDAIGALRPTPLANLGKVKIIRPDPRNPLVIVINVREMFQKGITTYNIHLKEDDIVYVPPTFLGTLGRFLERVVYPFQSAIGTAFNVATLAWSYQWMSDDYVGIF